LPQRGRARGIQPGAGRRRRRPRGPLPRRDCPGRPPASRRRAGPSTRQIGTRPIGAGFHSPNGVLIMSVKKEASGRRSVQVEAEGTPERVWQAIATGPGISAWFVPTQLDGRVGGTLALDFGGGMVSSATVTEWQPPHRFVAEDKTWLGGPPLATEWSVEAKK